MPRPLLALLLAALAGAAAAFAPPASINSLSRQTHNLAVPSSAQISTSSSSTTALSERQWNFNQGRGPFGLKKNAEIWNGRLAQMAFVVVLLQEAITGKGAVQALQDGDAVGYAFVGLAALSTVGLTAWLAIKGDESDIVF
ncbi:hypothetical protein ACHAXT_003414 [Thalassiosira profunda]